jgi:hypothetical protein
LGKFWWVSQWKMLCLMDFWHILQPFCIFHVHLVYFVVIWYIFPVLVCCTKKNLATLLGPMFFLNIFMANAFISPFSTQFRLSHFIHNSTAMFP